VTLHPMRPPGLPLRKPPSRRKPLISYCGFPFAYSHSLSKPGAGSISTPYSPFPVPQKGGSFPLRSAVLPAARLRSAALPPQRGTPPQRPHTGHAGPHSREVLQQATAKPYHRRLSCVKAGGCRASGQTAAKLYHRRLALPQATVSFRRGKREPDGNKRVKVPLCRAPAGFQSFSFSSISRNLCGTGALKSVCLPLPGSVIKSLRA